MGIPDFGRVIKGQTLTQIYEKYFADRKEDIPAITDELNRFEKQMQYEYVPGVVEFIHDLRRNGVATAIVTSSNAAKMEKVFAVHPELHTLTDRILTAECFTRSKPAPDCFLLGPNNCRCILTAAWCSRILSWASGRQCGRHDGGGTGYYQSRSGNTSFLQGGNSRFPALLF